MPNSHLRSKLSGTCPVIKVTHHESKQVSWHFRSFLKAVELPTFLCVTALDRHVRNRNIAGIMSQGHRECCFKRWFIKARKRPSCICGLKLSGCNGPTITLITILFLQHVQHVLQGIYFGKSVKY